MRLLLCTKSQKLAYDIRLRATALKTQVDAVPTADRAIENLSSLDYDLVVLDGAFGDDVQKIAQRTPTIALALDNEAIVRTSYLRWTDDCLSHPVDIDELFARIHAVIRRRDGFPRNVLTAGVMAVDLDKREFSIHNRSVHLTTKEYQFMEILVRRAGRCVTHENMMDHLYGGMNEPELKILDVFACKARKKLVPLLGGANPFRTVWGRGWVLDKVPAAAEAA